MRIIYVFLQRELYDAVLNKLSSGRCVLDKATERV
jgi:hypothetical protein